MVHIVGLLTLVSAAIIAVFKSQIQSVAVNLVTKLFNREPESNQVARLKAELAKEKAKNADA
jgi:hypothetical protein